MLNLQQKSIQNIVTQYAKDHLVQFRIGILPIAIETGRFKGLTENETNCQFCPHRTVDNEQHVLCTCSLYTILEIQCIIRHVKDVLISLI